MNTWKNFTIETAPYTTEPFFLMYKDHLWKAVNHQDGRITGVSPLGEIKLETSLLAIFQHDKENGDQTKWKRL